VTETDVVAPKDIPGYSPLRAAWRVVAHLLVTLTLLLPFLITALVYLPGARAIQRLWARATTAILGFQVRVIGEARQTRPTLFAANHVSYFDIAVFLRTVRGAFVAKSEVADWPFFGITGRLTKTVFIKRDPAEARQQRDLLVGRLRAGQNLILFPEGTSTDGSAVLPFKSSLFGVAEDPSLRESLAVQPVSICYSRSRDGTPLSGKLRGLYAWFGGANMVPHYFRALAAEGARVEVRFHPPIAVTAETDRKQLAAAAQDAVTDGVNRSHGEPAVLATETDAPVSRSQIEAA